MITATTIRQPKQVKPVSGSCRWLKRIDADGTSGVLTINGTPYGVHELTDQGRLVGYRLVKADGTTYDIDIWGGRWGQDCWECDCPDYLARRANRDPKGCKHCAALRAALKATPRN